MKFELEKLPYSFNGLAPYISAETLEFHYNRHHRAYLDNLNRLTMETHFADLSLEEIIREADGTILNNAAQVWNHTFYWNCLSLPSSIALETETFSERTKKDFGTINNLKRSIRECALNTFGSSWTWLVIDKSGHLRVVSTGNAENPMKNGLVPILACDLWEHAYYIDYRNERVKYMDAFLRIINWNFVSQQFESAINKLSERSPSFTTKIRPNKTQFLSDSLLKKWEKRLHL